MRQISPKIEPIAGLQIHLGETTVWSVAESVLYFTCVEDEPELLRWDPKSGVIKRWPMPERIGGYVLKEGGGALVVLASGLYDFDFASGSLELRVKNPLAGVALHEPACDPSGRLWVGSIDLSLTAANPRQGKAKFFRLEGDELVPVLENVGCANGLAISQDGRYLYFADSVTRGSLRFDLDVKTGAISDPKQLFKLRADEPGYPDGATLDAEGGYWVTLVAAGKLRRYLPDGTVDAEMKLPVSNPTKVSFGGPGFRTMFLTSCRLELGSALTDADGRLYKFDPGVAGFAEPLFRG
jgi:sugar lactone lactonase YvrE